MQTVVLVARRRGTTLNGRLVVVVVVVVVWAVDVVHGHHHHKNHRRRHRRPTRRVEPPMIRARHRHPSHHPRNRRQVVEMRRIHGWMKGSVLQRMDEEAEGADVGDLEQEGHPRRRQAVRNVRAKVAAAAAATRRLRLGLRVLDQKPLRERRPLPMRRRRPPPLRRSLDPMGMLHPNVMHHHHHHHHHHQTLHCKAIPMFHPIVGQPPRMKVVRSKISDE